MKYGFIIIKEKLLNVTNKNKQHSWYINNVIS